MISKYFDSVRKTISKFSHIVTDYSITEKKYSDEKGFLSGKLFFTNDGELDFAEVINIEFDMKVKYRYHFMNEVKEIVFRYDNTNHFPELKNAPHHKHLVNDVIYTTKIVCETLTEVLGAKLRFGCYMPITFAF